MSRTSRNRLAAALVAVALLISPGCVLGSPMAAFSGEPFGMTVDDVRALQGKRSAIWYGAPFFAAIDLPFAVVLDTAFLPISLVAWTINAIAGDDDDDHDHDHDHGHGHDHAPAVDCPPSLPSR